MMGELKGYHEADSGHQTRAEILAVGCEQPLHKPHETGHAGHAHDHIDQTGARVHADMDTTRRAWPRPDRLWSLADIAALVATMFLAWIVVR